MRTKEVQAATGGHTVSTGVIVAIVLGTFLIGAGIDRGSDPAFKKAQHKEFNDPSKSES